MTRRSAMRSGCSNCAPNMNSTGACATGIANPRADRVRQKARCSSLAACRCSMPSHPALACTRRSPRLGPRIISRARRLDRRSKLARLWGGARFEKDMYVITDVQRIRGTPDEVRHLVCTVAGQTATWSSSGSQKTRDRLARTKCKAKRADVKRLPRRGSAANRPERDARRHRSLAGQHRTNRHAARGMECSTDR